MTKELELLVQKWRALHAETGLQEYFPSIFADELEATLAKTLEGGAVSLPPVRTMDDYGAHNEYSLGHCYGWNACRAALIPQQKAPEGEYGFYPAVGQPPSWFDEWFIAKLDNGERVVLRRLPEGYSYDYTTADGTYFKAFRLKQWMQFPDSKFKQLGTPDSDTPDGGDSQTILRNAKFDVEHYSDGTVHLIGPKAVMLAAAKAIKDAALRQPAQVGAVPDVATLAGVLWCDYLTNDQVNDLARRMHGWLTSYYAMTTSPKAEPVPVEGEDNAGVLARESVGDGDKFVLVPKIPDIKMASAGVRASHDASILATNNGHALRMVWDAMIAAAPAAAWNTRAAGDAPIEHTSDCRIHDDGSVCDCGLLAKPLG